MIRRSWVAFPLVAYLWSGQSQAQLLQPVSDAREIYYHVALACSTEQEGRRVPSAPFAPFKEQAYRTIFGCYPSSFVDGNAFQNSSIFADSIYINGWATSSLIGPFATISVARTDAAITFRIESGWRCRYYLDADVAGRQSGGIAAMNITFAGPGVLDSLNLQVGYGPGSDRNRGKNRRGTLQAGEYTLEARVRAEAWANYCYGEVWAVLKLYAATAVEATTWGRVKALYR